jgi:hypothetical protein
MMSIEDVVSDSRAGGAESIVWRGQEIVQGLSDSGPDLLEEPVQDCITKSGCGTATLDRLHEPRMEGDFPQQRYSADPEELADSTCEAVVEVGLVQTRDSGDVEVTRGVEDPLEIV